MDRHTLIGVPTFHCPLLPKKVAGRGAGELADVDRSHEYVNVAMGGFEES